MTFWERPTPALADRSAFGRPLDPTSAADSFILRPGSCRYLPLRTASARSGRRVARS
jgi:hypothetical protein